MVSQIDWPHKAGAYHQYKKNSDWLVVTIQYTIAALCVTNITDRRGCFIRVVVRGEWLCALGGRYDVDEVVVEVVVVVGSSGWVLVT